MLFKYKTKVIAANIENKEGSFMYIDRRLY